MPPIKKTYTKTTYKRGGFTQNVDAKGKILVIVESPGKIKKLQEALGSKYVVMASVGHIIDLPPKEMGIDIKNEFTPVYVPMTGKEGTIASLKKASKEAIEVILASDLDREGEMIAWSLAHILNLKDPKRIVFNNTTKTAIQEAIANPKKINMDLVYAQKARRVLDRLVGYETSPILSKNMGQHSLSAGRVQSVVVKVILDREKEIEKFFESEQNSYFRFQGKFTDKKKKDFNAILYSTKQKVIVDENDDIKEEKGSEKEEDVNESGTIKKGNVVSIEDKKKTREIMKDISKSTFKFVGSIDKDSLRYPSAPFTTATLQQEAGRKLGFSTKRTMDTAQRLYEAGHITYHRTDSVNLADETLKDIKDFIFSEYGKNYHRQINYKSKGENTQEAHEAIRPTHVEAKGLSAEGKIGSDEIRLYNLIWKRSIASQMVPAKYKVRTVQIGISKLTDYYFQTKTEELLFAGYLTVYNVGNDDGDDKEDDENSALIQMPKIGENINAKCVLATEEFKKPPMRYSEVTLNKKIDPNNLNIGRPSTTATIIAKIQEREYVKKQDIEGIKKKSLNICWDVDEPTLQEETKEIVIGKEANKFIPTSLGRLVTDFLTQYFSDIMDYEFTSDMEKKLDKIAMGKGTWHKIIGEFYKDFHKTVEELGKKEIKFMDKDAKDIGEDEKKGVKYVATYKKFGPVIMEIDIKSEKVLNTAPIKEPLTIKSITLEDAKSILAYPKILGVYNRKKVYLQMGRFGLYIKYGDDNINLKTLEYKNESEITLDAVIDIIEKQKTKYIWHGTSDKIEYIVLKSKFETGTKYFIAITDKSKKPEKKYNVPLPDEHKPEELTIDKVKEIVKNQLENKYKKRAKKAEDNNDKDKPKAKQDGGNKEKTKKIVKKTVEKKKK